jgi:hypothetical protein
MEDRAAGRDVMRRLLIRPGALGDFVLSLPALECLAAGYTEVWAAGPHVPLVRFAGGARSIASTGLDLLELPGREPPPALARRLASFDSIVSWYGSGRPEFRDACRALGLPVHFFPALPEAGRVHAADFYIAQARTLNPGCGPAVPRLRGLERKKGSYAVIHPFSGSAKKNWPLERYRLLARELEREGPVEWCAGPEEPLAGARRFADLHELAGWVAGARLYVGNDSGVTHLAAAAGAPVVALFGPSDPAVWAPRGEAVEVVATARPGLSIGEIPLEAVLAAARRVGRPA